LKRKDLRAQVSELLFACFDGDLETVTRICGDEDKPTIVTSGDTKESMANMCNFDRRTGLHLACARGHTKVARHLIKLGAMTDVQDRLHQHHSPSWPRHAHDSLGLTVFRFGRTPLDEAAFGQHQLCVDLVLEHSPHAEEQEPSPVLLSRTISTESHLSAPPGSVNLSTAGSANLDVPKPLTPQLRERRLV